MKPATRWIPHLERLLRFLLGLLLAGIFLYTGWGKLTAPGEFAGAILAYQLLPEVLVGPVAAGLPLVELAAGGLLLLGLSGLGRRRPTPATWDQTCRRWALILILLQLLVFLLVLLLTMARGLEIDCGCGLLRERTVGWAAVGEDLILVAAAAWLYWREGRHSELALAPSEVVCHA